MVVVSVMSSGSAVVIERLRFRSDFGGRMNGVCVAAGHLFHEKMYDN